MGGLFSCPENDKIEAQCKNEKDRRDEADKAYIQCKKDKALVKNAPLPSALSATPTTPTSPTSPTQLPSAALKKKYLSSNSDTINWDNINTENVTSALNGVNGLTNEAKELILNISNNTNTESEFDYNNIFETINSKLQNSDKEKLNKALGSNYFSETSPFISDVMYNKMFNEQAGGKPKAKPKAKAKAKPKAKSKTKSKGKSKKGGSWSDDDSSTSSTSDISSDSSLEDLDDSSSSEKTKKAKHVKKVEHVKETVKDADYLSSSAHTGGEFSESMKSDNSSARNSNNSKYLSTSVSVNTSQINMVSEY
jgi:hypothetical protein